MTCFDIGWVLIGLVIIGWFITGIVGFVAGTIWETIKQAIARRYGGDAP